MIIPTMIFLLGMFSLILVESYWNEHQNHLDKKNQIKSLDQKKSYIDVQADLDDVI